MKDGCGIGASGIYSASPSRHWSVEPLRTRKPWAEAGSLRVGWGAKRPVEFLRLPGPVELWTAAHRMEVGPPKQHTVLAALLVDAGASGAGGDHHRPGVGRRAAGRGAQRALQLRQA